MVLGCMAAELMVGRMLVELIADLLADLMAAQLAELAVSD